MSKVLFGVPKGDVTTDVPDGVQVAYDDGETRNGLYDSRWVSDGCAYDAFRGERDDMGTMPYDAGEDSQGSVTGASSKKPVGRQW